MSILRRILSRSQLGNVLHCDQQLLPALALQMRYISESKLFNGGLASETEASRLRNIFSTREKVEEGKKKKVEVVAQIPSAFQQHLLVNGGRGIDSSSSSSSCCCGISAGKFSVLRISFGPARAADGATMMSAFCPLLLLIPSPLEHEAANFSVDLMQKKGETIVAEVCTVGSMQLSDKEVMQIRDFEAALFSVLFCKHGSPPHHPRSLRSLLSALLPSASIPSGPASSSAGALPSENRNGTFNQSILMAPANVDVAATLQKVDESFGSSNTANQLEASAVVDLGSCQGVLQSIVKAMQLLARNESTGIDLNGAAQRQGEANSSKLALLETDGRGILAGSSGEIVFAAGMAAREEVKEGMVVMAVHRGDVYQIERIEAELTAESKFPSSDYSSFVDFFQQKYKQPVPLPDQPLLAARRVGPPRNFLLKPNEEIAEPGTAALLPPSLCSPLFFAALLRSASLLPSVVHRLEGRLLAAELREMIERKGGERRDGHVRGEKGGEGKEREGEREGKQGGEGREEGMEEHMALDEIDRMRGGTKRVPLDKILEAMTRHCALEEMSRDRVELIGDCVLKMMVSCHLFRCMPFAQEGLLTEQRTRLISNAALFRIAATKGLQGFLRASAFTPSLRQFFRLDVGEEGEDETAEEQRGEGGGREQRDALAGVKEGKDEKFGAKMAAAAAAAAGGRDVGPWDGNEDKLNKANKDNAENSQHVVLPGGQVATLISPKTLGVMVKALTGAQYETFAKDAEGGYFSELGLAACRDLICWFGILVGWSVVEGEGGGGGGEGVIAPSDFSVDKLEELQRRLGYRFRQRWILQEALTHPSCDGRVVHMTLPQNYQRLEFLGDAVLDFVVTVHIDQLQPNLAPGDLSRLRAVTPPGRVARLAMRAAWLAALSALPDSNPIWLEAIIILNLSHFLRQGC